MLERLEKAFARQRCFVADASHELRTPTTVICNVAEMALLNAVTREECVATLRAIIGESQRLGHLVNDLLALTRTDEGQTQLEREPVRLDLLAQAVVAHLQPLALEKLCPVVVHFSLLLPEKVMRRKNCVGNEKDSIVPNWQISM